jgi:CheY-like chemotaxis protein
MLLQKPFTPDGIAQKVHEVLSSNAYYAGKLAGQKPRILLVDDDTEARAVAQNLLSETYEVTFSDTTERALAQIKLSPPDVVICACKMTGLDGPELYSSIIALNPHLVEHFLFTATASDGDRSELLRGIERPLIRKPFVGGVLHDAVWLALTGKPRSD